METINRENKTHFEINHNDTTLTIQFKPEIKLAPYYHADNTSPNTQKRIVNSFLNHWIIAPTHSEELYTSALIQEFQKPTTKGTFVAKGATFELPTKNA